MQGKAGSRTGLALTASEAGQEDAPERPGHFPKQEAQAVGASKSLPPVCPMLAPRIPGSTTRVACWLSPRGARGRFWQLQSARFQLLKHVLCKALFGWVRCFPGSPPNTARQGLSLTSYPARAEAVPQPEERSGAKSNTGHTEVGKHRRHVASARGESTTVFHKALGCYRDRQTHHTEGADRTAAAGDTGSLLHQSTGRPDYCVIPGGPNSIRDPAV